MSEITIENTAVDSNVLRSEISYSSDLQPFFSGEDFRAEYNVDVSDVPEGILTIPVLAHVCPVAWFQGADVYVPKVDAKFYESLREVRETLLEMYPDLMRGGDIYYTELSNDHHAPQPDESGLLFTGGIDSMFSFIRLREENPALININGWALKNNEQEKWERMQDYVGDFSHENGTEDYYIRSNQLTFLRNVILIAHCDPHVLGAWYSSIGHGFGLPGLCAPLAYATGIGDLYMAATHWNGASFPWGSRPRIVDSISWTGTENHHDGYEYTRQERIDAIAEYAKNERGDLTILTCSNEISENCGHCEKCCRTALGMLIAGADPNELGLPLSSETFDYTRSQLETGNWKLSKNKQLYWNDLRDHVPSDPDLQLEGADEFFAWLREADLQTYAGRERKSFENRFIYPIYRNMPYQIFNTLDSLLSVGPFTGRQSTLER